MMDTKESKIIHGRKIIIPAIVCIMLIVTLYVGVQQTARESQLNKVIPMETDAEIVKHPESIDFPGFEQLRLEANVRQQNLRLYNPAGNDCYFVISIALEDGEELWKSGLVPPGYYSEAIKLNKKLPSGKYEGAVVSYEAYSMDENKTPLNSGRIELFLNVR